MTIPLPLSADNVAAWPRRGAFSLPSGEALTDGWLDQVLDAVRQSGRRTAWLPADGGLISNLSLIENCLLPVQWQERLALAELEARFTESLGRLGLSANEAGRFRQRPSQASPRERQQTVFLRALMQRPEVLVIAGGALRGKYAGEPLDTVWPQWMSDSLLLYVGSDGPWPELPAVESGGRGG
jgi:hypothetical protein